MTRKLPCLDDVAGVGAVALVEDPGPGGEGARHGDVREALQLGFVEIGEERHALQQLDGGLLPFGHAIDYGLVERRRDHGDRGRQWAERSVCGGRG